MLLGAHLAACATSEPAKRENPEEQKRDPVTDEYLDEQRTSQNLEDVPVRIDRTNDSDGEAFVITDSKEDAQKPGGSSENTEDTSEKPELTEEEKRQQEALKEEQKKAEQERLAKLEQERKAREEERRKPYKNQVR